MIINKYFPKDYVKVSLFGLNYQGRINYIIFDGELKYKVEYIDNNGDFQQREFYEDEIISNGP
jgi:hypothetical protein